MKFSDLIKNINENIYTEKVINIEKIKAQYNPDRFKFWRFLHKGPDQEVLNMLYSPHYRFLKEYQEQINIKNTTYYNLQKLYGRNDKWIINKINNFIELFESIKKYGCKEKITVLSKPLVENKYNNNFEIFEGHHRLSCLLILNKKQITGKVIEL